MRSKDKPNPSVRDIARICGVSAATVSRVINSRAGEVGPETTALVLRTMRSLNYRPPQVRQQPRMDTRTIGLASGLSGTDITEAGYFRSMVDHLLSAASSLRQNSILYASHLFLEDTAQSIRTYCDGRCDGLLVIIPSTNTPLIANLQERGFPFVIVGETGSGEDVSFCDIDNVSAATMAVSHLINLGHKRIAYTQGSPDASASRERETGYRDAMESAGYAIDERWIGPPADLRAWLQRAMSLPTDKRPTAIFCFRDQDAFDTIDGLHTMGLEVPRDISVVGVDDQMVADRAPFLTTIRQPYGKIAMYAVESLMAQITGYTESPQRNLIPGELIVRTTTSPPR